MAFFPSLQRFSSRRVAALRRGFDHLRKHPEWAAWLDGAPHRPTPDHTDAETPDCDTPSQDAEYRNFNHRYFARFGEQERMLADRPRMAFYHAAIARHVHPGDRVIDLGTGTGILAAFAARQGAARVYAIDHSEVLAQARRLGTANQLTSVEFIATHSREFTLPEPVDVIIHEQMGDFLFDEAMVANVTDLRDRLLRPGGRIVPSRFELFCEPVKIHDERRVPFIWELKVHGYDYACLAQERPQEPDYYRQIGADLGFVEHFLGTPTPILTLDLHTVREADLPTAIRIERTVVNPGRIDGLAVYFRTHVDEDLTLGSGPLDPERAPHWGFRILRLEAEDCTAGEVIAFTLSATQWSDPDTWRWQRVPTTVPVTDSAS